MVREIVEGKFDRLDIYSWSSRKLIEGQRLSA